MSYRRTYDVTRFSPLDQITRTNVGDLRLVWAYSMRDGGRWVPTPVAANGLIMYVVEGSGRVTAFDVVSGDIVWLHWITCTVPAPGEPGYETWGDPTWGDPDIPPLGGLTWGTISYAPELGYSSRRLNTTSRSLPRSSPVAGAETFAATYCRPSLPPYVIGTASTLKSNAADQSSSPVRESNARNMRSLVAPMNTSPPAVTIAPPTLGLPTRCLPSGRSSLIPSGTSHTISPVPALTAYRRAQGGL